MSIQEIIAETQKYSVDEQKLIAQKIILNLSKSEFETKDKNKNQKIDIINRISGKFESIGDMNYKEALTNELTKKYL